MRHLRFILVLSVFVSGATFAWLGTDVLDQPSDATADSDDSGAESTLVSRGKQAAFEAIENAFFAPESSDSSSGGESEGRLIEVTQSKFASLSSEGLVLVKFGAHWCGPCRKIVPELEEVAANNAGTVRVLSVDVDQEESLARQFDVNGIPKLVLLHNGKVFDEWTGYNSAKQLQSRIDSAPKSRPALGEVQGNPFVDS